MTQKLKILSIIGFLLIIVSLVILHNSPAQGYEISIYTATPISAWLFLISSICIALFIIVRQAFGKEEGNSWAAGFMLLIIPIFIIMVIPALRGYFAYDSGDPLVHIVLANEIIKTGHFFENFYPFIHVLIAQASNVTGILPYWSLGYVMPFISVLYIFFSYLLARLILPQRGQVLLATAASTILFYSALHVSLYPNGIALLLVPLVFYFYLVGWVKPSIPDRILLILLLLISPFIYAPVSLIVTMALLATELLKIFLRRRFALPEQKMESTVTVNPALISFIMVFLWASSFLVFNVAITRAWGWLRGEAIQIPAAQAIQERVFSLGSTEVIQLGIKLYGDNMILIILSGIASIIIIRRMLKGDITMDKPLVAVGLFAISGVAAVVLFIAILAATVGRLLSLNYAMWITPVLAGFILYEFFRRFKRFKLKVGLVTTILAIILTLSISGLYYSPLVGQPNPHLTYSDASGNEWVKRSASSAVFVSPMGYEVTVIDYPLGYDHSVLVSSVKAYPFMDPKSVIPDHFGYVDHDHLADSISERFLVITEGFREVSLLFNEPDNAIYYAGLLGRAGFNENDFNQLELDSTVSRLYSNQGIDVYYVYSLGEPAK